MGDMVVGGERKVMVAVDESESSYYALMWVLDNLKESIERCPLVIFMAQSPPSHNLTFSAPLGSARMYCSLPSTPIVDSLKNNQTKLSTALLEKAKNICASRGVSAETVMEMGDPQSAICSAVQKYNISMLVLGDRGLGKIKRALIGSVSNYCVQYAKCPVLVVKKP